MSLGKIASVFILSSFLATTTLAEEEIFTGDLRLSCEAILCLSTGTRPNECMPSIARYFSINHKKWSDTIRGRINFLNMCPATHSDQKMNSLIDAIANGAGRCDAASLNSSQMVWRGINRGYYISNNLPNHCSNYTNHSYTDLKTSAPRYVGTPQKNGYWVEATDYDKALKAYNEHIAKRNSERSSLWND